MGRLRQDECDRGIDAIHPPRPAGKRPRVHGEIADKLRARLDAGPTVADKVCTLRGKDVQRILRTEMGVKLSLNAAYATLHRLGYSCLAPRPTAVKQTRYEWVYLYAAVEPATGESVALQAPLVNTETFNVFLGMLSGELGPQDHAVLILDRAGWHKARKLVVPGNITMLYLPPYSPELNPVERLWAYLRSHYLANRVYDDSRHLLDAGAQAWQQLTPDILRSVCSCTSMPRDPEQ